MDDETLSRAGSDFSILNDASEASCGEIWDKIDDFPESMSVQFLSVPEIHPTNQDLDVFYKIKEDMEVSIADRIVFVKENACNVVVEFAWASKDCCNLSPVLGETMKVYKVTFPKDKIPSQSETRYRLVYLNAKNLVMGQSHAIKFVSESNLRVEEHENFSMSEMAHKVMKESEEKLQQLNVYSENKELKEKNEKMREMLNERETELSQLKAESKEYEKQADSFKAASDLVKNLEDTIAFLEEQVEEKDELYSKEQSLHLTAVTEKVKLREEQEALGEQIQSLRARNETHEIELEKNRDEIETLRQAVSDKQSCLDVLQERFSVIQDDNKAKLQTIEDYEMTITNLEEKVKVNDAARKVAENMSKAYQVLIEEKENIALERDQLSEEVAALKEQQANDETQSFVDVEKEVASMYDDAESIVCGFTDMGHKAVNISQTVDERTSCIQEQILNHLKELKAMMASTVPAYKVEQEDCKIEEDKTIALESEQSEDLAVVESADQLADDLHTEHTGVVQEEVQSAQPIIENEFAVSDSVVPAQEDNIELALPREETCTPTENVDGCSDSTVDASEISAQSEVDTENATVGATGFPVIDKPQHSLPSTEIFRPAVGRCIQVVKGAISKGLTAPVFLPVENREEQTGSDLPRPLVPERTSGAKSAEMMHQFAKVLFSPPPIYNNCGVQTSVSAGNQRDVTDVPSADGATAVGATAVELDQSGIIQCPMCNMQFGSMSATLMNEHIDTHLEHMCPMCSKSFPKSHTREFEAHVQRHFRNEEPYGFFDFD